MLKQKITEDLKLAQKERDEITVLVIRMILSEVKNTEIEKKKELTDDQVLDVVLNEAKKRKDSIVQFKQGDRADLVEKEKAELKILEQYLPKQLSGEEVRVEVQRAIVETGASSQEEMGKVMGSLVPKLKGKADGKLISKIVNEELSK